MTVFLSISDIQTRWSCGRTFVYSALAEMERDGYLRRLQLGRVSRVAVEAVEKYEAVHCSAQPQPDVQGTIVKLRATTAARAKTRAKKPPANEPIGSILAAWRALREERAS